MTDVITSPLDEIRSAVQGLENEIATLSEKADITADEDARLDAAIAEHEVRAAELARLEKRAAAVAGIKAQPTQSRPGINVIVKPDTFDYDVRSLRTPGEMRDRAMRVLEDKDATRFAVPGAADRIDALLASGNREQAGHFLATMRPEYIRGFAKMVTGQKSITEAEAHALDEARAWSVGTDSATIPELFDPQIILANAGAINPFRELGTIKTGTADVWEGQYTGGITASWDAEATEVSDDDPAFTRPTITAAKAAVFVPFSVEFQGDAAYVVAELAMLFADAKNRLESTAFATGSGSGQPKGVITALDANASSEVTPTTDGAFGVEDLYKLMNTLAPRWRANSSWVASMNVANRIRAFGTALGHSYTSDLNAGYSFTPLGRTLYESSDYPAPTTLTTGAQNLLTFGDHSRFFIYDRVGLAVEFIPHLFSTGSGRPTGQRGVYGWWRTGSDVIPNVTGANANPPILLLQNQ